ncbi:MAG: hypothetical protein M1836_002107 [Candelina mexicana]|nr:MAG: hypothetical protein M1836_002107 [Candelina mexicana]
MSQGKTASKLAFNRSSIQFFYNGGFFPERQPRKLTMLFNPLESLVSLASSYSSEGQGARRPRTLHISQSFSRLDPAESSPLSRTRASTLHTGTLPAILGPERTTFSPDIERKDVNADIFEAHGSGNADGVDTKASKISRDATESSRELPIELMSLTDRFIDSLSAKIHPTPPSVERLSDLFQEFYVKAEGNIATHISALSSRQHRRNSPAPSVSSRHSSKTQSETRAKSTNFKEMQKSGDEVAIEQQMLTPTEIADRRRARKLLEQERLDLEEAVERRACENIYDRIWRHRSTQDEERDEKLRSRTAALAVVGIGLKELGIDLHLSSNSVHGESEMKEWLAGAREGLIKMNDERYPAGKLLRLTAAHKAIVDALSRLFPSSSSADEILPTLIYTLITTPPEGINVISNLYFIQRFRAANKINGEAAYVLTNLEAAISFLETVDLSSLKDDEAPEGPPKMSSRPSTPKLVNGSEMNEYFPSSHSSATTAASVSSPGTDTSMPLKAHRRSDSTSRPTTPMSPLHQRRISNLLQPPASAIGAASDAVITSADQGFKNISNSLENSYKFLLGRLKEQHAGSPNHDGNENIVPKTLDDARRLVGTPPPLADDGAGSVASSAGDGDAGSADGVSAPQDDKLLSLIGGRSKARDKSSDSDASDGNGRRVGFTEETDQMLKGKPSSLTSSRVASSTSYPVVARASMPNPAVESMRNLGTTLNPLNRLAGLNVMRGFSRGTPTTPPPTNPLNADKSKDLSPARDPADTSTSPASQERLTISPPIKRFLDTSDAGDLRISEVAELLADYRRLAGACKDLGII